MRSSIVLTLLVSGLIATLSSCDSNFTPNGVAPAIIALGEARAGLSAAQLAAFDRGRLLFEKSFKPSEGLGPLYNTTSCGACHSTPVTGGSSPIYRNFYLTAIGPAGAQFSIAGLPSLVVPSYGAPPHAFAQFTLEGGRAVIPATFSGQPINTAQRNTPPIFGVGLFETIPDATIAANADPDDADGDGISGRFNTGAGAMGRFGFKAQSNNIELFTRAPLQNQMGITTDPFQGSGGTVSLHAGARYQISGDPDAITSDNDGIPDPELGAQDLGDLIAFTRFLAPPTRKPFNSAAARGEALFGQLGCTSCHLPSLDGGEGPVEAYTDLLLHDMGSVLADGISMGVAQAAMAELPTTQNEFRTAPLWGVAATAPFLHDGRADTLTEAIILHEGESAASQQAFLGLSMEDRADVIAFLEAL